MKPFFACMILTKQFYTQTQLDKMVESTFNFTNLDHLHVVWNQSKKLLKDKHFVTKLQNLDAEKISESQIKMLHKLYDNDRYMNHAKIRVESEIAAALFNWSNEIIQF